jgi:hypothetical protein
MQIMLLVAKYSEWDIYLMIDDRRFILNEMAACQKQNLLSSVNFIVGIFTSANFLLFNHCYIYCHFLSFALNDIILVFRL